jgi:hypothetical protein
MLKAAFKRFQELPSLLPETDPQQSLDENKTHVQKLPSVVAMSAAAARHQALETRVE